MCRAGVIQGLGLRIHGTERVGRALWAWMLRLCLWMMFSLGEDGRARGRKGLLRLHRLMLKVRMGGGVGTIRIGLGLQSEEVLLRYFSGTSYTMLILSHKPQDQSFTNWFFFIVLCTLQRIPNVLDDLIVEKRYLSHLNKLVQFEISANSILFSIEYH